MQCHVCLIDSLLHQRDFPWQVKLEVVTRQVCFCLRELSTENWSKHLVLLPVDKRRLDFHHLIVFHFKGPIRSRKLYFITIGKRLTPNETVPSCEGCINCFKNNKRYARKDINSFSFGRTIFVGTSDWMPVRSYHPFTKPALDQSDCSLNWSMRGWEFVNVPDGLVSQ